MDDRRTIWLTVVGGVFVLGGTAFISGIVSSEPSLWIPGLTILVVSTLGFSSLLKGLPFRSLAKTHVETSTSTSVATLPFLPPFYTSGEQEMYQLGPHSWMNGFGPNTPELTLRAVVAIPAVSAIDYSAGLATTLRGEAREVLLIDLLENSQFTSWLREPFQPSPWLAEPKWQVRGSSSADLTQLIFAPMTEMDAAIPFQATCAVLTGWRSTIDGVKSKALRFLIELQINGQVAVESQNASEVSPTVPTLISLERIASNFVELTKAFDLSSKLTKELLSETDLQTGYYGLWLSVRGRMLEQVIDLAGVDRLPGAISIGETAKTGSWKSPNKPIDGDWGEAIASMFDDLLERAGYRGISNRFDWLR